MNETTPPLPPRPDRIFLGDAIRVIVELTQDVGADPTHYLDYLALNPSIVTTKDGTKRWHVRRGPEPFKNPTLGFYMSPDEAWKWYGSLLIGTVEVNTGWIKAVTLCSPAQPPDDMHVSEIKRLNAYFKAIDGTELTDWGRYLRVTLDRTNRKRWVPDFRLAFTREAAAAPTPGPAPANHAQPPELIAA